MDKLELYLDQVCRSIGGPRPLREHVRQELREHLLDALAHHQTAGLPEPAALDRALEEFGKPEEVRSELEATHGHRMMAVVIDKALDWKEMTMKAKWLWMSWAYIALVLVVALEVFFIISNVLFIIPKFQKLVLDGMIDATELEQHGLMWMLTFVDGLRAAVGNVPVWYVIVPAAAWGLFEWRVHSENKPLMRLSALGTTAVALMVISILMAGSMVIPFTLAMPAFGRMTRPFAVEQVATADTSMSGFEQALAKKDWGAMLEQVDKASNAMTRLSIGPAVNSLTRGNETQSVEELRAHVKAASDGLREAQQAIQEKDAGRLEAAMQSFRKSYAPLREAAKRPAH